MATKVQIDDYISGLTESENEVDDYALKRDSTGVIEKYRTPTVPTYTVIIDSAYTQNTGNLYDNLSDALTRCNALLTAGATKVTLRDLAGVGLGTNDYYTLRDSGIYYESPYDPWVVFITQGGNLLQTDLMYNIKQSELSTNIEG